MSSVSPWQSFQHSGQGLAFDSFGHHHHHQTTFTINWTSLKIVLLVNSWWFQFSFYDLIWVTVCYGAIRHSIYNLLVDISKIDKEVLSIPFLTPCPKPRFLFEAISWPAALKYIKVLINKPFELSNQASRRWQPCDTVQICRLDDC